MEQTEAPSGRDAVSGKSLLQTEPQRFEEITLSDYSHGGPNRVEGRPRILRASDVLLSFAGRSMNETLETPQIKDFKEALRLFPPFRDEDGAILGAVETKCPDCDAVFTSQDELKEHYLTRFCPGAAVAVYVMTRDRLITKGYRMEKRLMPLNCRPVRFFCAKCEKQFALADDEFVERQKNRPTLVDCKNCGEKCNVSYEPILNDPRDDANCRDVQQEIATGTHSRSPSIATRSIAGSKFATTTATNGEQYFTKRARKIRDSLSFRKSSQSDEDELIAISFAGLYELERVHAPNGVFQTFEGSTERFAGQSGAGTMSAPSGLALTDHKRSTATLCEEGNDHPTNSSVDSEGDHLNGDLAQDLASKRESLFQKFFGRKTPKGLSRAKSASKGKKLIKRVNTVRFSLVPKRSKDENLNATATNEGDEQENGTNSLQCVDKSVVPEAEYVSLLRGSQNIYIHMQYISGGVLIHDASGRQRILQMDEVAQLFLMLKDDLFAANAWSTALTTRFRADAALKDGNAGTAVEEYGQALKLLAENPALDIDKLSRATMLHSLGHAWRSLEKHGDSEACYLEALGLHKRSLGRDHPKNFAILHDLAALCEKDGFANEAAQLYERSFAGRLKTLGHNAPETLNSMQDLASLKVVLGDLEAALLLFEKAVPALDTVFGLQNETTLNAMNQLSLLYQKLDLEKQSRAISAKTIPHCRTFFGIDSPMTRDMILRYLQNSENFDFPQEIKDTLDQYQRSRNPDALRVVHRLGRSYMDAGLNREAADLFEALVDDFLAIRGPEAAETFDALSALCVSREHLDSVEKAIHAYNQLVRMASRTPKDHHSHKRVGYAEKRIAELNRRREVLAAEKKEWGLEEPGPCEFCSSMTANLCNVCKIHRFCNEDCRIAAMVTHFRYCIPSVSLRESKSLAVKPKCPPSTRDLAISRIGCSNDNKVVNVTASYTFYLDPRNFTTFRMKLSPTVNTAILFSMDSDIQYATLDSPQTCADSSSSEFQWLAPEQQDSVSHIPSETQQSQGKYVIVTPGKEMHKSIIDKRISVRGGGGDRERFSGLKLPNNDLIEYAQGLLLTGYLGEAFMYVIEWEWK